MVRDSAGGAEQERRSVDEWVRVDFSAQLAPCKAGPLTISGVRGHDWQAEKAWVVTADEELFHTVRAWAHGDLRERAWPAVRGSDQTLLIATPAPWRTIVAIAQTRGGVLRPMVVLKNAVALWALGQPFDDGPVSVDFWPGLRRQFMIHNPGLEGMLRLIDRAYDRESTK